MYFLTTLYVDVKEPAPNFFGVNIHVHFRSQKNSISRPILLFSWRLARRSLGEDGDKIESNLQSQMYVERPRTNSGPASCGTYKLTRSVDPSTVIRNFLEFSFRFANHSGRLIRGRKRMDRVTPGFSPGVRAGWNGIAVSTAFILSKPFKQLVFDDVAAAPG